MITSDPPPPPPRTRALNKKKVLKYLVMASILHESKIDPFDSQEAKPYKEDPEIVAMTNLVTAFRNKQIKVSTDCWEFSRR